MPVKEQATILQKLRLLSAFFYLLPPRTFLSERRAFSFSHWNLEAMTHFSLSLSLSILSYGCILLFFSFYSDHSPLLSLIAVLHGTAVPERSRTGA